MRRFESESTARFWEITFEGCAFVTRHGKIGGDGRATAPRTFESIDAMREEADKRIAAQVAKGYVEVSDPPSDESMDPTLEDALRADPAPDEPWRAWRRAHEGSEEPRAILAAWQDVSAVDAPSREVSEAEARFLKKHGPRFVPRRVDALVRKKRKPDEDASGTSSLIWRHGFIVSARLGRRADKPAVTLREATALLLAHPSARFLEELVIGALGPYDTYDYAETVAAIAAARPGSLRRLVLAEFSPEQCGLDWSALGALAGLSDALPALRELRLHAGKMDLAGWHAPSLHTLEIGTLKNENLELLAQNRWPSLHTLDLDADDGALDGAALRRVLENAPELRRLALQHTADTRGLLEPLVHSDRWSELERLDLSYGTLDDDALGWLGEVVSPDVELTVHKNRLSDAGLESAREAGLSLVPGEQRRVRDGETLVVEARVRAFAPDAQVFSAAHTLAVNDPAVWPAFGRRGDLVWAQCQGGGLYDLYVDAGNLDAGCTCPSPKYPCKHTVALLLLAARDVMLPDAAPPHGLLERAGAVVAPPT